FSRTTRPHTSMWASVSHAREQQKERSMHIARQLSTIRRLPLPTRNLAIFLAREGATMRLSKFWLGPSNWIRETRVLRAIWRERGVFVRRSRRFQVNTQRAVPRYSL